MLSDHTPVTVCDTPSLHMCSLAEIICAAEDNCVCPCAVCLLGFCRVPGLNQELERLKRLIA